MHAQILRESAAMREQQQPVQLAVRDKQLKQVVSRDMPAAANPN